MFYEKLLYNLWYLGFYQTLFWLQFSIDIIVIVPIKMSDKRCFHTDFIIIHIRLLSKYANIKENIF